MRRPSRRCDGRAHLAGLRGASPSSRGSAPGRRTDAGARTPSAEVTQRGRFVASGRPFVALWSRGGCKSGHKKFKSWPEAARGARGHGTESRQTKSGVERTSWRRSAASEGEGQKCYRNCNNCYRMCNTSLHATASCEKGQNFPSRYARKVIRPVARSALRAARYARLPKVSADGYQQ